MIHLIAFIALTTSTYAATMTSTPLSGDDIATILGISASKSTITFNSPQVLILRYTNGDSHQDSEIGKCKEIDLVTYSPNKDGGKDSIGVIVTKKDADGKSISSFSTYFPSPSWLPDKGRYTRTGFTDGIFYISGSQDKNFSSLTYSIAIIPKNDAEQGAAANP